MSTGRFLRRLLSQLVLPALGLPIVLCIVLGLARLLFAMGDAVGARAADRVALVGAVLWIVVLIALIVVQALLLLETSQDEDGE